MKHRTSVAAMVAGCVLVACKPSNPDQERSAINAKIATLPAWHAVHPLGPEIDEATGPSVQDALVLDNDDVMANKVTHVCTITPMSLTKNPEKIVALSPDNAKLWVGALLQGDGYAGGLGSLQALPISQRAPLKIRIDLLGDGISTSVDQPTAASVQEAIGDLVQSAEDKNAAAPSKVQFRMTEASSVEDGLLKLGMSAKYMNAEIKASLDTTRNITQKTMMAYFIQNAFTVTLIEPHTPADWFTPEFTQAEYRKQVELGLISERNLPVYVSSITFGRMLVMSVTSSASTEAVKGIIEASWSHVADNTKLELTDEQKNVLNSSNISVVAIGGERDKAVSLIKEGRLNEYFVGMFDLDAMKPISFQVDNLGDGSAARFAETTDYYLRECEAIDETSKVVGVVARLGDLRGYVNSRHRCAYFLQSGYAEPYGEIFVDGLLAWQVTPEAAQHVANFTYFDLQLNRLWGDLLLESVDKQYEITSGLDKWKGWRLFLDGEDKGFHITGNIHDKVTRSSYYNTGTNTFDYWIRPPFQFAEIAKQPGNSRSCQIDLHAVVEQKTDAFSWEP